jgi:formylglycine-generating enzyme required for sulfatase activity
MTEKVGAAALVLTLAVAFDGAAQTAAPKSLTTQPDGAEMVLVPNAGPFVYGIAKARVAQVTRQLHERAASFFASERPPAETTLPPFYVDRFEVTNEQYRRFLTANPQQRKPKFWSYPQYNSARQPVVGVGWADAEAYAKWAGKRLPTEEEWEKAARGSDGRLWPWGNTAAADHYNGRSQGRYLPTRVGSSPAGDSPYGAADMAGNVWEMTSGLWDSTSHAMRGGSFLNDDAEVRTTVRWAASAEAEANGAPWLGFRCVQDVR